MRKEHLKIRDDVDLKELEKFGFLRCPKGEIYRYRHKDGSVCGADFWIRHKPYSREICFAFHIVDKETLCVLFDLISAGLVEKGVEDET